MTPNFDQIKKLPDDAALTPVEVARLLGFTSAGIIKKLSQGRMKGVRVSGKWYIMGKEIKAQIIPNVTAVDVFTQGEGQ